MQKVNSSVWLKPDHAFTFVHVVVVKVETGFSQTDVYFSFD